MATVPALLAGLIGMVWFGLGLLVLPLVIAWFFRDPDRVPPADPRAILAPADGRVMHAGPPRPDEAPPGTWQQVTIFLSVLDVHINRTPVAGRVSRIDYVPGSFRAAFRRDAHRNEHSEIWIQHEEATVVVRQVVGVLARRVVCRLEPGDRVGVGDRIGLMKFGSRMDVFLPPSATILVTSGDRVRGGVSVIARLGPAR
jgi:phosphatidylserine decarboxylase